MLVVLSLPAPGTQAQETTNICDRTQQIQDAILRSTGADDTCESVLVSHLATVSFSSLENMGIVSLKPGDFNGVTGASILFLGHNNLTELSAGVFSGLSNLLVLTLNSNELAVLSPDVFSGLTRLSTLFLNRNQLNELPDGVFAELTNLVSLDLSDNPGAPFRFTLRFEPEALEGDFTAEPVRLVSDKTALLPITVPLSVIGQGGRLITGSPDSLTIAAGSTQSDTVTVIRGEGYFRLAQESLQFGGSNSNYPFSGFEIVRDPPLTFGGIPVRVKIFLEGALE